MTMAGSLDYSLHLHNGTPYPACRVGKTAPGEPLKRLSATLMMLTSTAVYLFALLVAITCCCLFQTRTGMRPGLFHD